MMRKNGDRFSAKIMLKQRDVTMIRTSSRDHRPMAGYA